MNIKDNLESKRLMEDMADALDISYDHFSTTPEGQYAIIGKDDKPLKIIQYLGADGYFYYIQADNATKCTWIVKKLTSIGMKLQYQYRTDAYLSMRRLLTPDEAIYIRRLIGIKQKATDKQRKNSGQNVDNLRRSIY